MSNTAFVSIGDLRRGRSAVSQILETAASGGCSTSGGAGKASCGSSAGPEDMPPEIWEKVKNHPCYTEAPTRSVAPPRRSEPQGRTA